MSQIGIKLANHDFFPIIDDISSLPIEKEVELTTVRDAQPTVQINLFLKDDVEEINYIGTLMIEDLKDATCEDASILLSLHLDKDKNLRAQAVDKNTGNKQSFSISIEELNQNNLSDFDFNIDDIDLSFTDIDIPAGNNEEGKEEEPEEDYTKDSQSDVSLSEETEPSLLSNDVNLSVETEPSSLAREVEEVPTDDKNSFNEKKDVSLDEDYLATLSMHESKKTFPMWLKIFLVVLVVCILALIIALFLKDTFRRPRKTVNLDNVGMLEKQEEKPIEVPSIKKISNKDILTIDTLTTEPPKKKAEPFLQEEKEVLNVKVDEEEAVKEVLQEKNVEKDDVREEAPRENVKRLESGAISKEVRYRLRYGDTLWDLAENFYKNPWQYKKIARYNGIKNPSYIIAGRYITIPAK